VGSAILRRIYELNADGLPRERLVGEVGRFVAALAAALG